MKVSYSDEKVLIADDPSIFLAGPTPRKETGGESWRPKAIRILKEIGFGGIVYVPEPKSGVWPKEYIDQAEWEWAGLLASDAVVFWIPRNMKTMPALTTNTELGWIVGSQPQKCVYGRPDNSEKNRYPDVFVKKFTGKDFENTLEGTLRQAVILANKRNEKENGNGR